MKEREFLNKINDKSNKDGKFTTKILSELLSEEQSLAVRKKTNPFASLLRRFIKTKSASQIISDNFELILGKTTKEDLNRVLEKLMRNSSTLPIIKENFTEILKKFNMIREESYQKYGTKESGNTVRNIFLATLRKCTPNAEIFLIEHIDEIIQQEISLVDVKILKDLSRETDEKLNSGLEIEKKRIIREILEESLRLKEKSRQDRDKLLDDYLPTAMIMIDELLKSENARMIDIRRIGRGGYCRVYQIGEKVFKIGRPRETYKIPNHPRILQPLTRTPWFDEKDNNSIFACIEISDLADELEVEDIQKEKLYRLYKELRDDGIIWTDAKFQNVGKLRKENIPTLNGEKMNVNPQAVGMSEQAKGKTLQAGDWVIIDTDYIYSQDDNSIDWKENSYSIEFEKRWQQEQQSKIAQEHDISVGIATQECDKELAE